LILLELEERIASIRSSITKINGLMSELRSLQEEEDANHDTSTKKSRRIRSNVQRIGKATK
jgi:F0F1-type ATP synthase membrane subunit b/b'